MSASSRRSVWLLAAWLLCGAVSSAHCASAQPAPAPGDSSPYVAQTWTTEDGLPQTSVWALEEANTGHLWVGTLGGLARFDGHSFTNYDAATTPGLPGNRIRELVESSEGTLWIGTSNGVSKRRNGHFQQVEGVGRVRSIDEGPEGTLWLGGNSGFYRSTRDGVTQIPLPDAHADRRVWDVESVAPDSVWIVMEPGILLLYHQNTFHTSSRLPAEASVRRIDAADDGTLWAATTASVLSIQNDTSTRYPYAGERGADLRPKDLRAGPSGTVWLTTYDSGLFRLSGSAVHRVRGTGVVPNDLGGLHRDDSGQWWVGTLQTGLIRLRPRLFHPVTVSPVANNSVHGVYADGRGNVWAGTSREGLAHFDNSGMTLWTERHGLPNETVWSVTRDSTGALWVSTNLAEVLRHKNGRFEAVKTVDNDSFHKVHALYRDPDGQVWIGSMRQGIHRYVDGSLRRVLSPDRLPSRIVTLHRTEAGVLWIGTQSNGVARYTNDTLTWYDADDGVPYKTVRDVYETDDGTIWIATYGGGIARFDPSSNGAPFTPVTPQEGLPHGTIHAIREAPDGIFWMTSNMGVFRVPRAQVEAVADGRRDRLYAQTFGPSDGMPTRECNGNSQPSITKGAAGHFWIPTMEGLTTVDPHDPRLTVPNTLPVRVTEVRADGTPRSLDSLRFSPSTYRLAIDFTAISLRYADDLSFRYRLDDGPWTPAHGRRTAEFTTLDAGAHQFEVQATINGATWYTLDAPFRFTVAPHFYETNWFRLLVLVGLFGFVGGIYLWRTRALRRRQEQLSQMVDERTAQLAEEKQKTERQAERLEALDEQKNRFFANVSHELRTPLTILQGTLQDATDGAFGNVPAPLQRQLEIMRSNVDRLRRLTDQLLDLSRLETAGPELNAEPRDLVALLRHTVRSFAPLAERRGLNLDLDVAVETHPCRVDPEKMEKILGNLLSNALQHTPEGGSVQVSLDVEDADPPVAVFQVTDTGRGIAPERQDEIFERFAHSGREDPERDGTGIGLSLVREYVDLHDGSIALDSTPGEGSTFTVRLPLPPADPDAVEPVSPPDEEDVAPMVSDDAPSSLSGDGARRKNASENDTQPVLLLVEDNADVRAYLRRHLSDTYRIVEATGGAEGLNQAREVKPDLVLSDLMMPEMDGIELCQQLRADDALGQTPVLLLTARAAEEDTVAGLEAGADAYVTKPFSIAELQARLKRLLESNRTGTNTASDLLAPNVEVTSVDEEFLTRVTDAIDEHLSRSGFTVDDLAAEVGLSPRQLQRKLKRLTDTTAAAFIRRYRLNVAAQLLKNEAGTVSEVAYEVGFGTLETFTTRFEEQFGCPPSAYPEEAAHTESDS